MHDYGNVEDNCIVDENESIKKAQEQLQSTTGSVDNLVEVQAPAGARISVGGKKCRCGSTSNVKVSHKSCPLNKSRKAK